MKLTPAHIEYTNLKPDVTHHQIDKLVNEAKENRFYGICVPPFWVKRVKREVGNSGIRTVTVAGYPIGYQMTETKEEEVRQAIRSGADEIDLVMNVSALKADMNWVKIEFARCAKIAHDHERILKVILETSLLTDDEIVRATKWAVDAGVDYIKTSTGFIGDGAKDHHIELIKSIIPDSVGIKASGGIRTAEHAVNLIKAGADKIGTSTLLF